ncbi:ATP-binding protein [Streptomyces rochei]|uniref:ATP-binding protein n=1 Tax=Streptomyces rochei TaxID=1928 RepID=UPI003697CD12
MGSYWLWPLLAVTPDGDFRSTFFVVGSWVYYALVIGVIAVVVGRLGNWAEAARRVGMWLRTDPASVGGPSPGDRQYDPETDPARWPQVRAEGAGEVADRLTDALVNGRMTDVDYARISHAWLSGRDRAAVAAQVRDHGAAACAHFSGGRDLSVRRGQYDVVTRQVRLGAAVDDTRTPHAYRGAGVAVGPDVLGTSLVAAGPQEITSARVVRPVVEAVCLDALARRAAVVAVVSHPAAVPAEDDFDVVVRPGGWSLDLYADVDDADVAAGLLAECLVGDLAGSVPGGEGSRAAAALAQVLGPWRAVHGAFPTVPELRALLDESSVRAALRAELEARQASPLLRELDAFERRAGAAGGLLEMLGDRLATLDRPALAELLAVPRGEAGGRRVFSLRDLHRPVRVRLGLPAYTHPEASRMLARLVLAQFAVWAPSRPRDVFALLALDDAAGVITPHGVRALHALRSSHAGAVLALRTLADVPEALRGPLLAASGCRVACAGLSTWDAQHFAAAWGTKWVEDRTVTHHEVRAEEPMTKVVHAIRRLATGQRVTRESVTTRREERPHWTASELAGIPADHAVINVSSAAGDQAPPVMTKLG